MTIKWWLKATSIGLGGQKDLTLRGTLTVTQLPMPIALLFLFTDNQVLKELSVVTPTNLSINLSSTHSWRRKWQPTPVLLPGKSHGQRNLVGCSPWGLYELDTTEQLDFHFSLSCIGEGNGNPLQCSCLENPRDGGAWWPAVYGVTELDTTEAT